MKVAWMPWGEAAFERARIEDKPILLSISAVWCHWCHVMDDTTYANDEVIAAVNERYVPVRVDNDERPDINARYNMGGWPTTAFLTPDGSTLTGATYLPPGAMLRALDDIAKFYRDERGEIDERSKELRSVRTKYEPTEGTDLTLSMVDELAAGIADSYDPEFGGFGDAPKFPQPEVHDFLLTQWRATGDTQYYDIVAHTMREMAGGGMYDSVEGGFFRYSTTRDWSVPHFEKMSEDHAGLLRVLAQLQLWTPSDDWRRTIDSALSYVRTTLRDPLTGFFAGSQDADEEYFALSLDARRARKAPYVDPRSYTNWTAALAGAFAWASTALDDPVLASEAIAALDGLNDRMLDDDGLLLHVYDPRNGSRRVRGLLTDHASHLRALLDAHETTGEPRMLMRAREIAERTISRFGADDGGFYDHAQIEETFGRLEIPDRPLPENGVMAENLLRLETMTGDPRYRQIARGVLELYARTYARAGSFAATYARALRRFLTPAVSVRIEGPAAAGAGLREAARRLPAPFVTVYATPGPREAAFVCRGTVCAAPAHDPAALASAFESLGS